MKENKGVIYIGNFLFPNGNAAGKRVYGNMLVLKKLNLKCFCFCFNNLGTDCKYDVEGIDCFSMPYVNGIKRIDWRKPWNKFLRFYKENILNKYDIKYIIMYGSLSTLKFNKKMIHWSKKNGIKILYDHVDMFPTPAKNNLIRYIYKKYENKKLKSEVFQKCDGIISISNYLANFHSNYSEKIVIPPLVKNVEQHIERNDEIIRIIYVGSISDKNRPQREWKDRIDIIIKSICLAIDKGADKLRLFLVGFTKNEFINMLPFDFQKEYNELIDKHAANITFLGKLPNEEAKIEIRKSDFSILLRDNKITSLAGFPTKISESLSCGIPAIVNLTGDLSLYLKNSKNSIIVDYNNIVSKLIEINNFDKGKILILKKYCEDNPIFAFDNYVKIMNDFLLNLNK